MSGGKVMMKEKSLSEGGIEIILKETLMQEFSDTGREEIKPGCPLKQMGL